MSQRGNYTHEFKEQPGRYFYWPSKEAWGAQMRFRRDIDRKIKPFFLKCCDGLLWLINKF